MQVMQRSWHAMAAATVVSFVLPIAAFTVAADPAADKDPRRAEVEQLIDRYFKTWSNQDIARYGQCFMPQAVVQLIEPSGGLISIPLTPFLKSQQDAQSKAAQPMTETPETVDIRFEGELARVVVHWKLIDGARTETGYDHFTLMRTAGKWRIANLIFYTDKPAANPPK
jgi:hypothetical protein